MKRHTWPYNLHKGSKKTRENAIRSSSFSSATDQRRSAANLSFTGDTPLGKERREHAACESKGLRNGNLAWSLNRRRPRRERSPFDHGERRRRQHRREEAPRRSTSSPLMQIAPAAPQGIDAPVPLATKTSKEEHQSLTSTGGSTKHSELTERVAFSFVLRRHLPPWEHITEAGHHDAAAARQQLRQATGGEDGFILGASVELLHMPLQPKQSSREDQEEDTPDPADEIWWPTPRRHYGTKTKPTIHTAVTGTSPPPSPSGVAAGEGFKSARGAGGSSQAEEEEEREERGGK